MLTRHTPTAMLEPGQVFGRPKADDNA